MGIGRMVGWEGVLWGNVVKAWQFASVAHTQEYGPASPGRPRRQGGGTGGGQEGGVASCPRRR